MQHLNATTPALKPPALRLRIARSPLTALLRHLAIAAIAYALIFAASSANANDRELGEYLSSQCTTCHQLSGKAKGIPPIIGWDRESFIVIMNSYKKKERENKVMQTIAGSLTDEDISALATYFGSLKPAQ